MVTDLVERLRREDANRMDMLRERLEAAGEITHLRSEVEHWSSLANRRAIEVHDQRKRADAAEARVDRLRVYCSAAARDMSGFAEVVREHADIFPRTLRDLIETSEFMALAAEGRENGALYEDELSKAKARVKELEEALEHVTELLVDTWHYGMPGDPEDEHAVMNSRAALRTNKEVA